MAKRKNISSNIYEIFPESARKALPKIGRVIEYPNRTCLFRQGDPGDFFFIIKKGGVTFSIVSHHGQEIILNQLSVGEAFGEIAMFDKGPRTTDAFTDPGTELIKIGRKEFLAFLNTSPDLIEPTLELLCGRLRWCSELLEDFLFNNTLNRLINKLVRMAEKHGQETNALIEIMQEELAKMLGTSREAVNRHLQLLQDKRLIILQRKRIIIIDVKKLKAIIQ